jgi:hypothetical protein
MPLDAQVKAGAESGGEPAKVMITPPKFQQAAIHIRGTAPLMVHKFSEKSLAKMEEAQRQGSRAKKGSQREARAFEEDWKNCLHISTEGWYGVPASGFRSAMIDACRMAGFQMTRAKMSIFVVADGYDRGDNTPLVRIIGEPDSDRKIMPARNDNGSIDLRCRPIWSNWEAVVSMRWDADQFSDADVVNLLARAGIQVGICEGRPFSKNSNGMGYGTFEVLSGVSEVVDVGFGPRAA